MPGGEAAQRSATARGDYNSKSWRDNEKVVFPEPRGWHRLVSSRTMAGAWKQEPCKTQLLTKKLLEAEQKREKDPGPSLLPSSLFLEIGGSLLTHGPVCLTQPSHVSEQSRETRTHGSKRNKKMTSTGLRRYAAKNNSPVWAAASLSLQNEERIQVLTGWSLIPFQLWNCMLPLQHTKKFDQ